MNSAGAKAKAMVSWFQSWERLGRGDPGRYVWDEQYCWVKSSYIWWPSNASEQASYMWDISVKERVIIRSYFGLIHLIGIEKQAKAHIQMSCTTVKILYSLVLLISTDWAVEVDGESGLQSSWAYTWHYVRKIPWGRKFKGPLLTKSVACNWVVSV